MGAQRISRMTAQRMVILEELRRMQDHPTAHELYEKVRRRLPRISLGTVYRNLETLVAEGLIQKLALCGTHKRFDPRSEAHHHIRCTGCGALDDVLIEDPGPIREALRIPEGYEVRSIRVEFQGLCPACRGRGDLPRQQSR